MNALIVSLLDLHVAFAACLRDIRVVDRRIAVDASLDVVNTMAIVTRRRDDQPHLEQRPAMDAIYVLGCRLRAFHLVFLSESGAAMACGASVRQVQLEHW